MVSVNTMTTYSDTPDGSPVNEGEIWQLNKSLAECNRHMLESGLAADVTFRVSSNTGESILLKL